MEHRTRGLRPSSAELEDQGQLRLSSQGRSTKGRWWICLKCGARHQRLASHMERLRGADVVRFGKFSTLTYEDVSLTQQSYRRWIVRTHQDQDDASPGLQRLARYILAKQADMED